MYSLIVSYAKQTYNDRLRAISAVPPWARSRASSELWRSSESRGRKPINNIAYPRADALLPTNLADTPIARVRAWWRTECTTPPADQLCPARLYARHASALRHVAFTGGCYGDCSSSGACWLSRTVCDPRAARAGPAGFAAHGWRPDEGRRSCRSTITHRCLWPHVWQHAYASTNDTTSYAAAKDEHADQQPCDAAATTCHEPSWSSTITSTTDATGAPTAPAVT